MDGSGINTYAEKWVRRRLLSWFEKNKRDFPWRKTSAPYHILVAEVMLRQTFAEKVVPVYNKFLTKYSTVNSLSKAKPNKVRDLIYPLGLLYRAEQLIDFANELIRVHGGVFPEAREDLEALPGVGPYTASAILCFAFNKPEAIIDTNILRVYRRVYDLGEHSTKRGPDKVTIEIAKVVAPEKDTRDFNLALLDFAAKICTHYSPKCAGCPIVERCAYNKESLYGS